MSTISTQEVMDYKKKWEGKTEASWDRFSDMLAQKLSFAFNNKTKVMAYGKRRDAQELEIMLNIAESFCQ